MSTGNEYSVSDIEKAILHDLGSSITLPDTPGIFIRFDVRKRGDKAGWCLFYVNEHCVVALYGSWISGQRYEWVNKEKKEITPAIRREMEESRKRRDREIKAEQDRVAAEASALYLSLPEAPDDFPYLQRKDVRNYDGLLHFNEAGDYLGPYIAIPLFNAEGEIRSLERIYPDGTKRFMAGGEKRGCFCVIGELQDKAFLCEGYATGASIHEATGIPVVIAFDCHNLKPVADAIGSRVKLICVADNDEKENGTNPGVECARETGLYTVVIPEPGKDANDFAQEHGLDELKEILCPSSSEWIEDGDSYLSSPQPLKWWIKNWIPEEALVMIYGASNAGKSFIALDMLLTMSTGRGQWQGYRAKKANCLYLCGEGRAGLRGRVALWVQEHKGSTTGSFKVSKGPKRLNEQTDLEYACQQIDLSGMKPDVIVVDTLNRHFSGNENDAEEMGGFIESCTALQERYHCTVIIIHHTGVSKDAEGRARGSSSLNAAIETSICITNEDGYLTLNQTKQRDIEKLPPFSVHLRGATIEGWFDEDGEPVRSAVVESIEEAERDMPEILPAGEEMTILADAWLWSGCGTKDGYPALTKGELRAYMKEELKWSKGQVNRAFYTDRDSRFLRKLQESFRITVEDEQIFIVNRADITVCFLLEKNKSPISPMNHPYIPG